MADAFPSAASPRSVGAWIRSGWHVAVAYVIGFFAMLSLLGWHPHEPHKGPGGSHDSRNVSAWAATFLRA